MEASIPARYASLGHRAPSFRGAMLAVSVVAVLLVMAAADVRSVSAQNQPIPGGTNVIVRGQGGFGGGGFFPYGGFGGYGMAGTPQSAAEFGLASVIAARGYADLQHSVAARNYLAAQPGFRQPLAVDESLLRHAARTSRLCVRSYAAVDG